MHKVVKLIVPYILCTRIFVSTLRHSSIYSITDLSCSKDYSKHWLNYSHIMASSHFSTCDLAKSLSEWTFTTPCGLLSLPMDSIKENYVRRYLKNAIFSSVHPTPIKTKLQLVDYSEDALVNILDMDPEITTTDEFLDFVAGNKVLSSSTPLAHRYGGHQFGVWASQLGDGRAILLGEYKNR